MNFFQRGVASLRKDIAFWLCVKLIALAVLWMICFQHPVEKTITQSQWIKHWMGKGADNYSALVKNPGRMLSNETRLDKKLTKKRNVCTNT